MVERLLSAADDRRPIDPPPIVQLRVIDRGTTDSASPRSSSPEAGGMQILDRGNFRCCLRHIFDATCSPIGNQYVSSFLQNPYYFMYASLAQPDEDVEIHWFNVSGPFSAQRPSHTQLRHQGGKTRCTAGSVVSSLYHLKDSENRGEDAAFFVFPDLSVRMEGSYRLKLSLFEVVGCAFLSFLPRHTSYAQPIPSTSVRHCKSIYSAPFYVYTAKKFPGMEGMYQTPYLFASFLTQPQSQHSCLAQWLTKASRSAFARTSEHEGVL